MLTLGAFSRSLSFRHGMARHGMAAFAFAFGSVLAIPAAHAAEIETPPVPSRLSIHALVGYSASTAHQDVPNIYGFAIGIRAGYTFTNGMYLGGFFSEHGGYSLSPDTPPVGTVPVRGARTLVGAEVGHDWESTFIYRLYVGGGVILDHGVDLDSTGKYVPIFSDPSFAAWPGGMVLLPIQKFVLGVDAHVTVPGTSQAAVGLEASAVVGARF
jgi:hypothetical protein